MYGCGCQHNCSYCYARSLLDFRGLWDPNNPRVADVLKIERKIKRLPSGMLVRLGGMTDCFQPMELEHRVTLRTLQALNEQRIHYLIVTKSHMVAEPEYLSVLDKELAHIQITVTSMSDEQALRYERASVPSKRIEAILKLQQAGFDVAIRLSPIIEEYMDFGKLNSLQIDKGIVEFLRINGFIKKWFEGIEFGRYTLHQGGYHHLPLDVKIGIIEKIKLKEITVCEDVTDHYAYWRNRVNANREDCCNLRRSSRIGK